MLGKFKTPQATRILPYHFAPPCLAKISKKMQWVVYNGTNSRLKQTSGKKKKKACTSLSEDQDEEVGLCGARDEENQSENRKANCQIGNMRGRGKGGKRRT